MSTPPATIVPSPFNCAITEGLPFGGAEILFLACLFLFLIVIFAVTFMDVAIKQMWPEKYLDPAVAARIAQIKKQFPLLNKKTDDDTEKPADPSATPFYNKVVSQAPYIAGRSVDEDLIPIICNNDAFLTVSSYCASTVRGYAMLSAMLLSTGMVMSFLWIHNAMVYPQDNNNKADKIALVGYLFIFLTGIVMMPANQSAVTRNANIAMWSNIPYHITFKGKVYPNPLLALHEIGVGVFLLIPMLAHGYLVYTDKTMPNRTGAFWGVVGQLIGALCFAAPGILNKMKKITKLMQYKLLIIGEIICVFVSFLAYVQYETFATATCGGMLPKFNKILVGVMIAPFAIWIKRHYTNAPQSFPTDASLMLMMNDKPVAVTGPVPALQYDQLDVDIPQVTPLGQEKAEC